jgi:hypothetical protein
MSRITLFLIIFIFFFKVYAQREQRSWKYYLSYSSAFRIVEAGSKIYAATEGGIYYFDAEDNSIQKFTEINGLNDFGIQNIAYNNENEVLIVVYDNSNIDLIYGSQVINVSDIRRKQITGDKTIYNITFSGNQAFLSCGFGIVVLNLDKQEIKGTYYIGEEGTPIRVNDVEIYNSFIFAATSQGILRAEKDDPDLLDYRNWRKVSDIPRENDKFSHLAVFGGYLLANYTPDMYNQDEMYMFNGADWERYISRINYIHDIQVYDDHLVVAGRGEILIVSQDHIVTRIINKYLFGGQEISSVDPRSAFMTAGTI